MPDKQEILAQRVQSSFKKLSTVAADLNTASDRLGKSVSALESKIKKTGIGITSWVPFAQWQSLNNLHGSEEIGYTKIGGKWGLTIRTRSGHVAVDEDDIEVWPFNEAPRDLRVRSLPKIPDLLDKLADDGAKLTKTVDEGAGLVDTLAAALETASEPPATVNSVPGNSFNAVSILDAVSAGSQYASANAAILDAMAKVDSESNSPNAVIAEAMACTPNMVLKDITLEATSGADLVTRKPSTGRKR